MKMIRVKSFCFLFLIMCVAIVSCIPDLAHTLFFQVAGLILVAGAVISSAWVMAWCDSVIHEGGLYEHPHTPGPYIVQGQLPTINAVVYAIPGILEKQIAYTRTMEKQRYITLFKEHGSSSRIICLLKEPLQIGACYIYTDGKYNKIPKGQAVEWQQSS